MRTWAQRTGRMHASIVSDAGPSRWATYKAPNGASLRVKGVYQSPFKKQTPQDMEMEIMVVEQEPRFGVRLSDFTRVCPLVQNAELVIDDEPACRYRVLKIQDTNVGWADMVLEKISK